MSSGWSGSASTTSARDGLEQLWTIRDTSTRGRGLFATANIKKGTLILLERPAATTNVSSEDMTRQDIDIALAHLTPAQHKQYSTLSDHGGTSTDKEIRIFQTNGITIADNRIALMFNVSLINHSCVPNANWGYRQETGKFFVAACTDIREDTEICTNYMHYAYLYTSTQRNAILQDIWKFTCGCEACSDTTLGRLSDLRRTLLFGLHMILVGDSSTLVNYDIALPATNHEDSCTVNTSSSQLTVVKRTRSWWVMAKLLEAEGICGEILGNAYTQALTLLQAQLFESGVTGFPLSTLR